MALSHELLSQFAKIVNTRNKTSTATTIYGKVVVDENGAQYVQPDGSNQLIPLDDTSTEVKEQDRVSVLLKDHTATVTGNMTSPAARTATVKEIENVLAGKIQANEGYIKKLDADKIEVGDLNAAKAEIAELYAEKATVENLSAEVANVTQLTAKKLDAEAADLKYATIQNLEATDAKVNSIEGAHAEFKEAIIEDLEAHDAEITNLKAKDAEIENAVVENLEATTAAINVLKAKDAEIDELMAKKASVDDLNATNAEIGNLGSHYANIDFANIGEAAIRKIFSEAGIIKELITGDAVITGELVGVTISGDLIKANTFVAEKLVVRGSDGNYYKLNTDFTAMEGVEPVEEDSIHGSNLVAHSITAEKVSVKDLVAFGATIGGFHINENAIFSGAKSSPDADVIPGVYLGSDGQLVVGDEYNFLKYYKDEDGNYKLAISTGGRDIQKALDEVDNLQIGARNLVRNSKTFVFKDYYFPGTRPTDSLGVLGTGLVGYMVLGKES